MSIRRLGPAVQLVLVVSIVLLAIAIPVGIRLASGDRSETAASTPDRSPLELGPLKVGRPPRNGYLHMSTFILNGQRTRLHLDRQAQPRSLRVLDGGFLIGTRGSEGDGKVYLVSPDGTVKQNWPVTLSNTREPIAVSDDGGLGALIRYDGTPVVVQEKGSKVIELPRMVDAQDLEFAPIHVTGSDCSSGAEET